MPVLFSALAAFTAYTIFILLRAFIRYLLEERKIRSLGTHAPQQPSWTPFGIDIVIKGMFLARRGQTLENFKAMAGRASRTIEMRVLGNRVIKTDDPEHIKTILATQFKDFGKGEDFRLSWHDFLGDGIFSTDGPRWHASRQLIRPQFIKDRVSDLAIFEWHVQALIKKFPMDGSTFDISDLFHRSTLDTATHFLLGQDVDSINGTSAAGFAEAFAEVQKVQMLMFEVPVSKYIVQTKRYYQGLKAINDFVNPFIEEVLHLPDEELERKTRGDSGYTFLHALSGFTKDRKVLRDQLVAVLLAGRDTTASALSWLFYELARNPNVVRKLRQEIAGRIGPHQAPTYDDLKGMKYLQHTISETLRLYPSVPFNFRLSLTDTTLPGTTNTSGIPIAVPKSTFVGYSALSLHRREDIYHNADSFQPERWETFTPKPWQYIPFNGGPRICIGQQFAIAEIGYFVVRILQRLGDLGGTGGIESRQDAYGGQWLNEDLVLKPGNGVKVAFRGM